MSTQAAKLPRQQKHYTSFVFTVAILLLLLWGFSHRMNSWLSAEEGMGYALGIIGGSLMLCLLLYPLRKRIRLMRSWLTVKVWFQMHMLFGILGPVAIAFHANFGLGSLNSQVATASMLLVVLSGLVGRYLYRRIHMGLYGQRASLSDLKQQLQQFDDYLEQELQQDIAANSELKELAQPVFDAVESLHQRMVPEHGAHGSISNILWATPLTRIWYWKTRRQLKKIKARIGSEHFSDINSLLKAQAKTVRKLVQLEMFSRLFAWWHVVHLPFFILMIITAVVHIYAVHSY